MKSKNHHSITVTVLLKIATRTCGDIWSFVNGKISTQHKSQTRVYFCRCCLRMQVDDGFGQHISCWVCRHVLYEARPVPMTDREICYAYGSGCCKRRRKYVSIGRIVRSEKKLGHILSTLSDARRCTNSQFVSLSAICWNRLFFCLRQTSLFLPLLCNVVMICFS